MPVQRHAAGKLPRCGRLHVPKQPCCPRQAAAAQAASLDTHAAQKASRRSAGLTQHLLGALTACALGAVMVPAHAMPLTSGLTGSGARPPRNSHAACCTPCAHVLQYESVYAIVNVTNVAPGILVVCHYPCCACSVPSATKAECCVYR